MATGHMCILMATFNGAAYVGEQLDSFRTQDHDDWSLHVSDDGSQDATRAIVADFAAANPDREIVLHDGPRRGSAANFLSLLAREDLPQGACLAFSDQDDVWMPHRLERARALLRDVPGGPAVYASRTIVANDALRPRGLSWCPPRPAGFGNALVQNVLAGNTIVLNPQAAALARRTALTAMEAPGVAHHDWWLYLLMTGAGASVISDRRPGLYYRQHDRNLLGANRGLRRGISRISMLWNRHFADWVDANLAALERVSSELTDDNRQLLDRFRAWRGGAGREGSDAGLAALGVWRQSRHGDRVLALCARLGRI